MTWDASSDLASTLVAVAPSPTPASSLSLTVTAGAGALFPVAPFDVLIHDQAVWPTKTTAEFARVLSVVGDVVTFSARALHGSSARTILVGDRISGVFTAEQLQAIQAQIDANTAAISTNVTAITSKAPLTSPALTGTPTTPTPTPGDNSTKIASTAFVLANAPSGGLTSFQGRSTAAAVLTKADVTGTGLAAADVGAALDSTAVHNTGAETVAGVKTFSSSPIVPDPTTAQQVSSKAYVDAHAGGSAMHALSLGNLTGAVTVPLASFPLTVAQGALTGNTTVGFSGTVVGARCDLFVTQSAGPWTLSITDGTIATPVISSTVNADAFVAGREAHLAVTVLSNGQLWVDYFGSAVVPAVPGAPTGVVGTPGNTTASIAFTPPASNGGSAITGYTATLSPGGATFSGSGSPISATGLTNGTAYTATVHATNVVGNSVESAASAPFTPISATVPGAPTALAGTPGNAQVALTWTAPGSNGGSAITDYLVQYRTTAGPGAWQTFAHAASTTAAQTVTGLTNGTSYDLQVAAVNAVGTGAFSASVTQTPVAGFTPASLNPIVWLDPASLSGLANNAAVTSWANSGSGPAAVQATGANQPTYKTAQQNGLGAPLFASPNFLSLGTGAIISTVAGRSFTVIVAIGNPTGAGYILAKDDDTLGRDYAIQAFVGAANLTLEVGGAGVIGNGGLGSAGWHVFALEVTVGGDAATFTDGVAKSAVAGPVAAGGVDTGATTIGKRTYVGAEGYLSGLLGEMLVFSTRLSAANRQQCEAYLKSKWATP